MECVRLLGDRKGRSGWLWGVGGRVWILGECCVGSGFMLVGAREVETR